MSDEAVEQALPRGEQRLSLGVGEDDDGFVWNRKGDKRGGEEVFGLTTAVGLAAG